MPCSSRDSIIVLTNEEPVEAMRPHAGLCFLLGFHLTSWALSYKVADVPIHLVNSTNETVNEQVDEIVLENLQHDVEELKQIPDPTNKTGQAQDNETTGFGGLAKQLEFMMLKMVQLETLCEMQQYEIETLRLKVKEHDKILAKDHEGLIQVPKRDPETHLKKTQKTLERVAMKHSHQLTTRDFHPSPRAPEPKAAERSEVLLEKRHESSSKHGAAIWNWFEDTANKYASKVEEKLVGTSDQLANSYQTVLDQGGLDEQIEFFANAAIDDVAKAVAVLTKGFSTFEFSCSQTSPQQRLDGGRLITFFGRFSCTLDLMGQRTNALAIDLGWIDLDLPGPLGTLTSYPVNAVKSILEVGRAMEGCTETRNSHGMKMCLAYHIAHARPMVEFLPVNLRAVVQTLGNFPPNAIRSVLKVGETLQHCTMYGDSSRDFIFCLAYYITEIAPTVNFLPVHLRDAARYLNNPLELFSGGLKQALQHLTSNPLELFSGGLKQALQQLTSNPLALMPTPLQTMATVGETLNDCTDKKSHEELLQCFGFKLLEHTPPLSWLLRLKEVMARYVEVFVQIGNKLMEKAMEENPALLQTALHSKFGAIGDRPIVHHSSSTLEVKTHVQRPEFLQQTAQSRHGRHERGDNKWAEFGSGWDIGNYGPQTASLITQFNGREKFTGSCLAFAPRTKTGADQQATEADWQVQNEDDFLKLEPYAVPCSNAWMQQNWNKWQGYSFYTWPTQVEKCITVNFNVAIQPVVALIGGVEFEVLPKPLAQLQTQVCWPNGQPGGVDLSVLRSQISCGNVMLFSRTLRLAKRFGDDTGFVNENINGGFQTWRSAFCVGYASGAEEILNVDPRYKAVRSQFGPAEGESSTGIDSMARSAFLQGNQSQGQGEATESLVWKTDTDDLYLASVDINHLGVNRTSELRGTKAAERWSMSALQDPTGEKAHKLFSFKAPALIDFQFAGVLEGNNLYLESSLGFGPYQSGVRRIPLANIAHQFSLVLAAMHGFVSAESRLKAIKALNNFREDDVGDVGSLELLLTPGSHIALHNSHFKRYVSMSPDEVKGTDSERELADGLPLDWYWARFVVVDAGNGEIALHSSAHNRFLGLWYNDVGVSARVAANQLGSDWTAEKFTVVQAGNGQIALHNKAANRFLKMWHQTVEPSSERAPPLPDDWSIERFGVLHLRPYLVPGSVVALHSVGFNRFVSMRQDATVDGTVEHGPDLPHHWTYEQFTVVDAGNGQVALHSVAHNRFLSMTDGGIMKGSSIADASEFKASMIWEKFAVIPVDPASNIFALHSTVHNRLLQAVHGTVQGKIASVEQLMPNWKWEQFKVVQVTDARIGANDVPFEVDA